MKEDKNMRQGGRRNNGIRLEDIKVRVHIPNNVSEREKQQRIDKIYNILSVKKAS